MEIFDYLVVLILMNNKELNVWNHFSSTAFYPPFSKTGNLNQLSLFEARVFFFRMLSFYIEQLARIFFHSAVIEYSRWSARKIVNTNAADKKLDIAGSESAVVEYGRQKRIAACHWNLMKHKCRTCAPVWQLAPAGKYSAVQPPTAVYDMYEYF